MCGLVGIAGKLALKDEAVFQRLLLLDYIRGPHATGVAAIRNNGERHIAKVASHPIDLFDSKRFVTAMNGVASQAFIGHNRLATKGARTAYNAHPYEFGHIVGAHNGTLLLGSQKELEELAGERFDVDSQALYAAIEAVGIKKAISVCEGAWALTWYDADQHTLNFLRNGSNVPAQTRPLWYAYSEDFTKIMWASEWPMMSAAQRLGAWDTEFYTDKDGHKFFQFLDDTHYIIDLEALSKNNTGKLIKPKTYKTPGKPKKVYSAPSGGPQRHDPFHRGQGPHGGGTTPTTTNSHGSKNSSSLSSCVVHMLGNTGEPFSEYMDREKFEEIAKFGCSWCQGPVDWGDVGITLFERDQVILCPECSSANDDKKEKHNRVHVPDVSKHVLSC